MKISHLSLIPLVTMMGCTIPRPETLVKDNGESYVDQQALSVMGSKSKARVAVFTSTFDKSADQTLSALLDAKIAELITSSTCFEIAERATLENLKFEELFTGAETGASVPTRSDFILLAKVVALNRQMFIDFRFYDAKANKTVLSKNIPVVGRGRDPFERALAEFALAFADMFEPKVSVIQTRGNGMVARISRGSASGVKLGMEVEFYEFEQGTSPRVRDTVGRGGVFECDSSSAWVEVDDYYMPSVKVRVGDYVEIITDPAQRRSRNVFTRTIGHFKSMFY